MNDPRNNVGAVFEQRLVDLEQRLEKPGNEESLLAEVGTVMRALLESDGDSESRIRQVLERQHDNGNLRSETYELVERLLATIAAESTVVEEAQEEPIADEPYTRTAVIEQPEEAATTTTSAEDLQIGTVLRDRFLLKERVSEGSMGTVFKALDRRMAETGEDQVHVAIKVLSPRLSRNGPALRALQQEAAKGRCLAHPNIVRFIDLDREDEVYFIIMEWLEGRSLSSILDDSKDGAIDRAMALDIVRQVASALDYAHQRGVIHADVKPGNIMITRDGQVKLIDFGVARVRQKENEGRSRFDPEILRAATPAYSSMQVLTGEEPVPADDVFSLACLAYRLIAGYRVFGPRNAADAAEAGMEPQPPDGLDPDQWQALKKALSYSRVTRFATPGEFVAALRLPAVAGPAPLAAAAASRPAPAASPAPVAEDPPGVRPAPSVAPMVAERADKATSAGSDGGAGYEPMRAERDPIMYEPEERSGHPVLVFLVLCVILGGGGFGAWKAGLLDDLDIAGLVGSGSGPAPDVGAADTGPGTAGIEELPAMPEVDVAETTDDATVEELVIDTENQTVEATPTETPVETAGETSTEMAAGNGPAESAEEVADGPPEPVFQPTDFSLLPPPTVLIDLDDGAGDSEPRATVDLMENGDGAIIDVVRSGDLSVPMEVGFVEVGSTGTPVAARSPKFVMQDDGRLLFEAGEPRARMVLDSVPDSNREPDAHTVLSIRADGGAGPELARIDLNLLDDDQRAFEARMPVNTVGFTAARISVREGDSAVQIDLVRYRPDGQPLEVAYSLQDVTATEGQDYFAPALPAVFFGPNQTRARILIPLGQDSRAEPQEVFNIVLETTPAPPNSNIYSQIAVMIQDDDSR